MLRRLATLPACSPACGGGEGRGRKHAVAVTVALALTAFSGV
jgi:hypothetical protein